MSKRYEFVLNDIMEKIYNGTYRQGDKIPTESQLTSIYDVSRITIQKAMNILVSKNVVERVAGRGTFVKALPKLPNNSSGSSFYAFVAPNIDSGASDIIKAAQDAMFQHGHCLSVGFYDNDVSKEKAVVENFFANGVKGLLVSLWDSGTNSKFYGELISAKVPIVFIDKSIYGVTGNVVLANNTAGISQGMTYLFEMGHRKIGYISNPILIATSLRDRITAYVNAMKKNGLNVSPSMICITDHYNFFENIEKMLKSNPDMTAVMCASDSLAIDLYKYAKERGVLIPDELSVCSFDGYDYTSTMLPPLTTVKQDFCEIGKIAAELLLDIADTETDIYRTIYVPTNIILRQSVKKLEI